ncbi:MAG: 2-oxo acid dehydrogenase subunit E2 [Spirochaetales bacterium]|nr:2-oxo acid dehydrogenase subunit E2 [Spirochaetales bacterium]
MGIKEIKIPDMGDFTDIPVIEIYVEEGETVEVDTPLIALESAKAVTDIPSPFGGIIKELKVAEGDTVSTGTLIVLIETGEETASPETGDKAADTAVETNATVETNTRKKTDDPAPSPADTEKVQEFKNETAGNEEIINLQPPGSIYHATPAVRQYAREQGVQLSELKGSGPNGRILKDDVDRSAGAKKQGIGSGLKDSTGSLLTERIPLTRIQKIAAPRLLKSSQTIPHVTQFNQANVMELEAFRKALPEKLSILPFIIKAVTAALVKYPKFNASLDEDAGEIILKRYYNIGIAVNTPGGLMVPVVKDADKKSISILAGEISELAERARNGKSEVVELTGATFTISSLGGVGGTAFTPIINPPETAILGISRISRQPVWKGDEFIPGDMLPLSLSYDHRVIDGAEGAEFTVYLSSLLEDIRRILL